MGEAPVPTIEYIMDKRASAVDFTPWQDGSIESFKDLILANKDEISPYLNSLSPYDRFIANHYFFMSMNQTQIAGLLDIVQAAVSHRLTRLPPKLKLMMLAPTRDPIVARTDLLQLFDDWELFEVAYYYFFEGKTTRVAEIVGGRSQVYIYSRIKDIHQILSESNNPIAERYLRYFKCLRADPYSASKRCKANDESFHALVSGPSIVDQEVAPQLGKHWNKDKTLRGIHFNEERNGFQVSLWHNGRSYYVGRFPTMEAASRARERKRKELLKKFPKKIRTPRSPEDFGISKMGKTTFRVRLSVGNQQKYFGTFPTIEAAREARDEILANEGAK